MISVYDMTVLNGIFISIKVDIILIENIIVTDSIIMLYTPPRCYVTCGHTIFMT